MESKLYQNGYTDPDTGDLLGNSNIYTNTFSFDLDNPAITVSNPLTLNTSTDATARYTGEGADKKTWYKEIIHWSIQVSDGTAGVAKVTINGTEMTGTALSNGAIGFDIESSSIARDCSCKLSVTVTDKVGHSKDYETTIYIDMFDPLIKEFRIEAAGGLIVSDASGNYTNGPVKVYVKAEDPDVPQNTIAIDPNSIPIGQGSNVQQSMPTSGLAKVVLYLNDDQSTVQFGEATTQTNGYYVFTIPAEVAENFYKTYTVSAEAYDNSGLKSAVTALTSGENGNSSLASEKIIIENKKPGAVITLSDTGKKTIAGNTWYGADTEVKIQATDAESGLATIAVTVNGTAITADDSATPQAIGTFASKEKASPVYVIKTANHIASDDKYTIRVTAKDVSGNVYETEETFFIDRTAPVISGFTVTTEKAGDTLSNLAFGTFANGRVRVTITVKDDGSSAGLDSVALTINDGTPVVSKLSNGVAEFILPEEVVEGFYGAYALKATAVDVYGHTSEVKTYERQIQIDTVKPTVSVSAAGPNPMAKDGKTWYSSDVTWTIRLRDANAGIASATVKVNGTVIATDANGKSISEILAPTDAGSVKDVTFAVISSQAASADGSYTITVETTDYIGNKSEVYSGTVYVDKTAPAITSFAFLRDGEAVSPLTASDFGYVYFFEKDATVVISANDAANGYGLKSITYYMEDFNGVKTAEQTATPDASGNVTITVKAPFRGKIYAKATDGVNNESGYAASKGFAAESKANHDGTASVVLERNETELRQPNGVDLYSGNVEIKINIADEIAGIKTVEWSVSAPYDQAKNQTGSASVGIDGTITGDGWTATAKDGNLVTGLTRTITVTHDSNDITVRVRMTDWAGNTTERQTVFGIDKVAPTVEYSFDNNTADPANPTIFDDERTLTITVTERNFVPGEFGLTIHNAYGSVPTISQWTEERDTQDPNKSTYTATVTFVYDGSYTLTLGYADRAGNRAAIEQVPAFVIDRSKPLVLVTYDNKKPVQDIYFDNFRTATVTVTERNFDVSRVTFTGNAPRTGTWTANGDEHTLTIYYDEDGDYSFGISVVDKAGNVSVPYDEERFIIDTTVPELELTGLLAANRGEVAPVITYTDANYMEDGVSFLLQRQNGDIINKPYTIEEIVEDGEAKGYRIVFKNFDPMKENDDIYTIQISAVDQAGNRTQQIMRRFSVNRFGSTYIMDGVEKMNGSNTNNPTDLVVLEVNVDEINADDVEIFVIRNSSPTKLVSGRDYDWEKVKMTEDGWEEYRYVIKSSSFAEDGEYTIRIISVDKAGNVNENDENGKNATISFCVDRVAPNIVVVSPVDETSYKEDTHRAVIEVRDNYLLGDVKIYLNDAEVSYSKSNYQYSFEIPQSDTKQTIRIVATDAAGNVSEVIVKDFLVSTNVFVRFLNTTWAIVAFIAILLCIGGAAVFILARRRRR
ncbi:MAG: Ig-like domain repeat protein [Lachnospiraceae bacterium]|nr:Ig-like domain repeat protein [Lachnospiraceae bacterium]